MGKSFVRTTWTGALLYAATLAALLLKRPIGDFPLPPLWFYFAWAVLPTLAGVLPLLIDAKSAWIRFPRFLVAVLLYGIAWVGQFRLTPMLGPIADSELAAGVTNFRTLSNGPLNYSLLAAFLCLGLAATGNNWATWGRAIWSGETDAMIAMGEETGLRRAIRIIVAGIVGTLAATAFVDILTTALDSYVILPTRVIVDRFVLLACQLLTIVASWRLARRKSGVMLALAMVSIYLLAIAVIHGDWQHVMVAVPAMFGLACAAAFVRSYRFGSGVHR